jgi:hypothetical protein
VFSSLKDVSEGLRSTGYIADSIAATTVYLAAKLHKPLLLEGPAGSGNTTIHRHLREMAVKESLPLRHISAMTRGVHIPSLPFLFAPQERLSQFSDGTIRLYVPDSMSDTKYF